jgi:hypothetical protein
MDNADATRPRNLTSTIVIAGSGVLGAVIVLSGLAITPQSAGALPTYADKERKECGYCHVNPAGGGALNGNGRQYEANNYTFKK